MTNEGSVLSSADQWQWEVSTEVSVVDQSQESVEVTWTSKEKSSSVRWAAGRSVIRSNAKGMWLMLVAVVRGITRPGSLKYSRVIITITVH